MVRQKPYHPCTAVKKEIEGPPRILTTEEFKALVGQLDEPYKTMVVTITCLGLRVCELLALQWGDIDFEILTRQNSKKHRGGRSQPTKTEAPPKPLCFRPGPWLKRYFNHKARVSYVGGF